MKKVIILLFPICLFSQQKLTLEEIWGKFAFQSKSTSGFNVLRNGNTYSEIYTGSDGVSMIGEFDLKTGNKIRDIVNGNDVKFNGSLFSALL